MTTPQQVLSDELPPMPSPVIGLPWRHNDVDGSILTVAFSERQMREYARLATDYALAALAQQEQEPAAWLVSLPDEPELGEWFSEQDMSEQGYTSKPLYTTPQPQPAPSVPVDERHRAVALELDRLMLVIESAVRWQDPTHHPAVLSLLKANRAALQSTAPQATKGQP